MDDRIRALVKHRYISVTTYRRDGRAVATPVWFALDGDHILVWTDIVSGKAKRTRLNGRAAVAPCDARGRTRSDPVPAQGRVLPDAEFPRAMRILTRRYRLLKPLVDLWTRISHGARRKSRPVEVFLEFTLAAADGTA